MNVSFVVDKDFISELDILYTSTSELIRTFEQANHSVRILLSCDANTNGFESAYLFDGSTLIKSSFEMPEAIVVRRYGMTENERNTLADTLTNLESEVPAIVNPGRTLKYVSKKQQKTLPLPFAKQYTPSSVEELEDILHNGAKIIAKPHVGLMSKGITYLSEPKEARNTFGSESSLANYSFEEFIESQEEIRIAFLNNNVSFARKKHLQGPPGQETWNTYELVEPTEYHKEVAHAVMTRTGMLLGSVDFRGKYVLEVNGSGIGIRGKQDFGQDIVRFVEKLT